MNLVYEAIDASGRPVRDVTEASTTKEAVETLRGQGLLVTHIARARGDEITAPARQEAVSVASSERLPLGQLMLFTRQMAMLLTSGSAVVPAMAAVRKQMKKPAYGALIRRIEVDIEEGFSLTDALCKHPGAFDPIYCAIVAAGESNATLPQMFTRLADMVGKRRAIRNRVIGAMAYPALLVGLCTVVIGILLFFVMPRFGEMFRTLRVPLPASTGFMLNAAVWVRGYWYVAAMGLGGAVAGVVVLTRSSAGRQWLSDVQIRVPVYGRLASRMIQTRILRVCGMLIESHVNVLESLDLARRVTRNHAYQSMLDAMDGAVTSGRSLGGALEGSGLVSPSICQAVVTGEQSGRLGEAIIFAADVLDEENTELIQTLTKLVEPLILIVMGVVVGGVAISLFLPLFDMTAAMH